MRAFDGQKIVRTGLDPIIGANGGRAAQMERKVFNAAMDLLKQEDEELSQMLSSILATAAKKTAEQIERLKDDFRRELKAAMAKANDDAPVKDVLSDLRESEKRSKDAHREMLAFIEKTADSITDAIEEGMTDAITSALAKVKPEKVEMPEIPKVDHLTPVRGADGKIKRVDVAYVK